MYDAAAITMTATMITAIAIVAIPCLRPEMFSTSKTIPDTYISRDPNHAQIYADSARKSAFPEI